MGLEDTRLGLIDASLTVAAAYRRLTPSEARRSWRCASVKTSRKARSLSGSGSRRRRSRVSCESPSSVCVHRGLAAVRLAAVAYGGRRSAEAHDGERRRCAHVVAADHSTPTGTTSGIFSVHAWRWSARLAAAIAGRMDDPGLQGAWTMGRYVDVGFC